MVSSPNACIETLAPNVTVLGDRVLREMIKVKRGHEWGPYRTSILIGKDIRELSTPVSPCLLTHRGQGM